jgi:uncharacterized protein YegL
MDKNYTDINIIVDRSGSMADNNFHKEMENGIASFLKEQAKDTSNKCLVTLAEFDTNYEVVYSSTEVQHVPRYNLVPRGGTALLDAIGRTIDERGKYFAKLKPSQRPAKILVLVITDGGENSSRTFNFSQVKEKIDHQKSIYNWEFVFLGAGLESFGDAQAINIKAGNQAGYAKSALGTQQMFADVSRSVASYRGMTQDQYIIQVQDEEQGFFQVK